MEQPLSHQASGESISIQTPSKVAQFLQHRNLNIFFLLTVLLASIVVFSISSPYFFALRNGFNIGRAVSITGIAAAFATLLMIAGGLDLSIGAVMNAAGVAAATVMVSTELGLGVAIAFGLGIGAVIGLANGIIVTKIGVNPIITTIGMQFIVRGLTLGIQSRSAVITDPIFLGLGQGIITIGTIEIPVPVILMLIAILVAYLVLQYTQFGKYIYAIGGNASASRRAGINVERLRLYLYVLSGLSAGFAGLVLAGLTGAGIPYAAGNELSVIAAVILGGVSLAGGVGTVQGTLLGVLLVGVLKNGMTLLNISANFQMVVEGSVLVIAVSLDQLKRRV